MRGLFLSNCKCSSFGYSTSLAACSVQYVHRLIMMVLLLLVVVVMIMMIIYILFYLYFYFLGTTCRLTRYHLMQKLIIRGPVPPVFHMRLKHEQGCDYGRPYGTEKMARSRLQLKKEYT
jgi:hypothetical protein